MDLRGVEVAEPFRLKTRYPSAGVIDKVGLCLPFDMKRIMIIAIPVLLILGLAVWIAAYPGENPLAPRFIPGAPATLPAYTWDHYDWSADIPVFNQKVWMWIAARTNSHSYLYDLDRRVVVGELVNAGMPVLWTQDGSKILCLGHDSLGTSFKHRALTATSKLLGGKLPPPNRTESFWVLDIRDNSATRLAAVSQIPGTGSRWHPSPGFCYGYTVPTTTEGRAFFLCDLLTNAITRIETRSELKGWWDDQHILVENGVNDFALFDIATEKSKPLFGPGEITAFLSRTGLTNDPAGIGVFANWNGKDFDFYFGPKPDIYGQGDTNSFLARIDKDPPGLRLLYREFQFRWSGRLNSDATCHLYQGESGAPGKGGNGAVYLKNLTNNTVLTLVAPDNKGQYAIPRYSGDEAIYFQNRLLRRVKLDGSSDSFLLPGGPNNR